MASSKEISVKQLNQLLQDSANVRLLDVRSESEFREHHIPYAEQFPLDKIEKGLFSLKQNELVVTTCTSGAGRSALSAKILAQQINREVFYLEGGNFKWFQSQHELNAAKEPFWKRAVRFGQLPDDSDEMKLRKSTMLLLAFLFALAGLVWGVLYFMSGLMTPGIIPFGYGVFSLLSIVHFVIWKNYNYFRFSQILFILLLPFFLQMTLGGYVPSSAVIIWSLISPLGALIFCELKNAIYWFIAYLGLVFLAYCIDDILPAYANVTISNNLISLMFLLNLAVVPSLIFVMQYFFVSRQKELKLAVEQQHAEISEKNKEITDSIVYAKRIQYTLLAHDAFLEASLKEHFVLFQPKDIVSGDFYWATKKGDNFYLAVCDSTGHGVPGAFMSLLNISFLNEAINEKGLVLPNEIFNHVRKKLVDNISQEGVQDGMDGILLCWNQVKKELSYAAANNAPYLIRGINSRDLAYDKMPIGHGQKEVSFNLYTVDFHPGDTLYLFTDGYADQFGGPKGKKFKYKQLQQLLASLHDMPLQEQKRILEDSIKEWKGRNDQTDDILILGLKV